MNFLVKNLKQLATRSLNKKFHLNKYNKLLQINKNPLILKYNYQFSTKLSPNQYIEEINNTLEHINDTLDEMDMEIIEANYDNSGVLNFQITSDRKFVLNIQRPNQQLWLSSPISGPFRFEFNLEQNKWFDVKNNFELYELLETDINKILKENKVEETIEF